MDIVTMHNSKRKKRNNGKVLPLRAASNEQGVANATLNFI